MGLGRLRLSPSAFYEMTLDELCAAARGDSKAEEQRQQMEWERTRWLATCLLQVHMKKGANLSPRKLAVFPWEKQDSDKREEQEAAKLLRQWANE